MKRLRVGSVADAVIALLVGGLAGCGDASIADGQRAVRAYCEAVIVAYQTGDVSQLRPLATDKELLKIVALIDIKTAGGLVLESTLESLEVTAVAHPSPGVMTVDSTEHWRYFDRPLKVGKPPGTEFVVEMDLEYTFVKRDGAWRMDQARTLRHDYIQPEGFNHDRHDSHGSSTPLESQ